MKINYLLGKTLSSVINSDTEVIFETVQGERFRIYHRRQCCEKVFLVDINGDWSDILNTPILVAEERSSKMERADLKKVDAEDDEDGPNSGTWTFYELATVKGSVNLRWSGTSNGYYSERVSFATLPRSSLLGLQPEEITSWEHSVEGLKYIDIAEELTELSGKLGVDFVIKDKKILDRIEKVSFVARGPTASVTRFNEAVIEAVIEWDSYFTMTN